LKKTNYVIENQEEGTVTIGGNFTIDGMVMHKDDDFAKCSKCGEMGIYYDLYDSFFCPYCNFWLDSKCPSYLYCQYCSKRPEYPIPNHEINRSEDTSTT